MINGPSLQEDITIVNMYTPNIEVPKYIKQTLADLQAEIDNNTVRVGNFNNPLSTKDRSSRQKNNMETLYFNCTLDQMDLIRHIQNILSYSSRMHILLKHTWKILQDRPYVSSQNKSLQI
uniref:Uncharacterized protein n=1 Tax=Equus caballus TaxID=9796 RepID=A0A9L0SNE3_HORSE